MNFKTTYILFGALLLLLGVAAYSLLTGPKKGEEGKLFPGVESKDVTRVIVDRKQPVDTKLVFVRTGENTWKLEHPYAANVNGKLIDSLIGDVVGARTVTKNVDLSINLSQFGLDSPSLVITLDAGGKSYTVNMGLVTGSAESGLVYVNTSENRDPVALRRSSLGGLFRESADAKTAGDLFKNIGEYRHRDLLVDNPFNAMNVVQSVRLKNDKTEIVLKKSSAGTWEYEKPAGFGEADTNGDATAPPDVITGVKPLFTALGAIRVASADDFIDNVTDFKQYGLEPGKAVGPTIELVRAAPADSSAPPITASITVGKKDEKGERVFVRPGDENVVVKLPANLIEPFNKLLENPSALRSRTLFPNSENSIDALDIQVGAEAPIELRRIGRDWKLLGRGDDAKIASAAVVRRFLGELSSPGSIREFPAPKLTDAEMGFDKPSAVVTLWVNGIIEEPKKEEKKEDKKDEAKDKDAKKDDKKEEKKEDKKEEKKEPVRPKLKEFTAKLIFGKQDKNLLFVRREMGGVKTDVAVSDSLLKDRTTRLAYLDRALPQLVPNLIAKLSFTRNGETWLVEKITKENAPPTWTIQQPTAFAGRPADEKKVGGLFRELIGLHVDRVWAENVSEKELQSIGLKPPRLQVTVSFADAKDKERAFLFGAEIPEKSQVYAKLGDSDLVYIVHKGIVESFQSVDILDMTVLRLDLAKVTNLKFTGWKAGAGQAQTLDLERRSIDKQWVVKGNDGYKLMPSKLDAFLELLATLRAEKFVVYKTGPKPEHKLTPADGALQVEITVEGEKEPILVTIGGESEDGKSFYAQCSKAPGDVFLVPKVLFEAYKSKFDAFSSQ